MPLSRYELWTPQNDVLVRPGRNPRDLIVLGETKPSALTTGNLPGVSRTTNSGNLTLSADNTIIEDLTITGRLSVNAAGCRAYNVRAYELVTTNINCEDFIIEDFHIEPPSASNVYGSGIQGHDFTARRGYIKGFIDGITVHNNSQWIAQGETGTYNTNVVVEHCWIDGLAYWTAATGGVVHPSDQWSHNDGIQHQGGWGSSFIGNLIDANLVRQYAHWQATNWPAGPEPWTSVALNSLGDGGPWFAFPNRGTGTEATGRYNQDSAGDGTKSSSLTCFLIGNNVGTSRQITFNKNWLYGGDFAFNGGGFNRGSETNHLLTSTGNRFSRDQGEQDTGGNNTYTFAGFGTGWLSGGFITQSGNIYEDNSAAINYRA